MRSDVDRLLAGLAEELFISGEGLAGGVTIHLSQERECARGMAFTAARVYRSTTKVGDLGDYIWESTDKSDASFGADAQP